MTKNQKKILSYLKTAINLENMNLIYDYDDNSVVLIDSNLRKPMIFHFIYSNKKIILINNI